MIKELAESGERLLDQERLMKEMEDDRIKMEKMFTIEAQDVEKLREKEVLSESIFYCVEIKVKNVRKVF